MKPEQMTTPIHFINSPEFHEPNAWAVIMAEPPPRPVEVHRPTDSLITRMSLPPFTRWEQKFYFRRMNFLLFQAEQLRTKLIPNGDIADLNKTEIAEAESMSKGQVSELCSEFPDLEKATKPDRDEARSSLGGNFGIGNIAKAEIADAVGLTNQQVSQITAELPEVGKLDKPSRATAEHATDFNRLLAEASEIRHLIIRANIPLISLMIRGHRLTDERISDAILILIRCVDKFNYSWGVSFCSYVTHSIKHGHRRTLKSKLFDLAIRAGHVMVDGKFKDRVAESPDYRFPAPDCTVIHQVNRRIVANAMRSLLPKWKEVMERRYGLAGREEQNATDIANDVGVTRSRIGQIEQRAHRDLRQRLSRFVTAEAK